MATKKQKREAALAKRAAFTEETRRTGLEAQKRDREERERREAKIMEEASQINLRHLNIIATQLIKGKH